MWLLLYTKVINIICIVSHVLAELIQYIICVSLYNSICVGCEQIQYRIVVSLYYFTSMGCEQFTYYEYSILNKGQCVLAHLFRFVRYTEVHVMDH